MGHSIRFGEESAHGIPGAAAGVRVVVNQFSPQRNVHIAGCVLHRFRQCREILAGMGAAWRSLDILRAQFLTNLSSSTHQDNGHSLSDRLERPLDSHLHLFSLCLYRTGLCFQSLGVWVAGVANVTGLAQPREVHIGPFRAGQAGGPRIAQLAVKVLF